MVVGAKKSDQAGVEKMIHELAATKDYAGQLSLPPKESKAYLSSIEFLESYAVVLREAADYQKSAGLFIFIPSLISVIALLLSFRKFGN